LETGSNFSATCNPDHYGVEMVITLICRFIVRTKRMQKYMTRIGQKTGTLNISKKVHIVAITMALVHEYLKNKIPKYFFFYNTQC